MGQIHLRVRVRIVGLRRKLDRLKAEVPHAAKEALLVLADQAIELIENAPDADRRAFLARAISRQLRAVFAPVHLLHVRREQWPELMPIYKARILRHQKTYQGRKLFYVDENKREALFDLLLQRALAKHAKAEYEVRFVTTYDFRYRVEIVKRRGKLSAHDSEVLIAFARQRRKVLCQEVLETALSKAGLR